MFVVLSRQRTQAVDASSVIIRSLSLFLSVSHSSLSTTFLPTVQPFLSSPIIPVHLADICRRGTVS